MRLHLLSTNDKALDLTCEYFGDNAATILYFNVVK